MRPGEGGVVVEGGGEFPRLRAGTFIEALVGDALVVGHGDFPALGRGLSLRQTVRATLGVKYF